MANLGWRAYLKGCLKSWVPEGVASFYHQYRKPLQLPDRSEVTLFAPIDVLPTYQPRYTISPDWMPADSREPISLIATVYNEAETIGPWLDSLLNQRHLPDEVVITDGGSTDDTQKILDRYTEDFPVPVHVIHSRGANISRGRNLAIAAASHEIVACSDCGSILDENWLNALTIPFALDPKMDVSAGYYDVLETNMLSHLARSFFGVDLDSINPQKFLPSGRSIAFKKRLWESAGGYPEWLTDAGEDTLFDMRLKAQPGKWAFVPFAKVSWHAPDTLPKLLRTYYRYSRGDGETGISAELYWYKVVELLRLWPSRIVKFLIGLVLILFLPPLGFIFFIGWLIFFLWGLWRQNRQYSKRLGVLFFPYSIFLEAVGTIQPIAFALGVQNRSQIQRREVKIYQIRLKEILAKHPNCQGVLVYPPTHDWGFMFQRPQQIARAFAKQGWLYFYCTKNGRTDSVFGFREVEPRLYLSQVPADTFAVLDRPVVYLGSAWNRTWLKYFNTPRVVYDHYDELAISSARKEDHLALLIDAEMVLVSAKRLLDAVISFRIDALLIPNGVDFNFIQSTRPKSGTAVPSDLAPILALNKPVVGYSGALANWFDFDLIIQVAQHYPELSFVLLGVDYDGSLSKSGLLDSPNIYYLGMKDYQELFEYIWRFDIAIIPFKINEITLATSPVKLFEYMACEKPVVTTALPECEYYDEVFSAKSTKEFGSFLISALNIRNEKKYLSSLRSVAGNNTWEQRVTTIIDQLSN